MHEDVGTDTGPPPPPCSPDWIDCRAPEEDEDLLEIEVWRVSMAFWRSCARVKTFDVKSASAGAGVESIVGGAKAALVVSDGADEELGKTLKAPSLLVIFAPVKARCDAITAGEAVSTEFERMKVVCCNIDRVEQIESWRPRAANPGRLSCDALYDPGGADTVLSRSKETVAVCFEANSWAAAQAVDVVELFDADETVRLIFIMRLFLDFSECSGDMDGQVGNLRLLCRLFGWAGAVSALTLVVETDSSTMGVSTVVVLATGAPSLLLVVRAEGSEVVLGGRTIPARGLRVLGVDCARLMSASLEGVGLSDGASAEATLSSDITSARDAGEILMQKK